MSQDTPLSDVLHAYGERRPREIPTLRTVLKTIAVPYWSATGQLKAGCEFEMALAAPAHLLYRLLLPDCSGWNQELAKRLPSGCSYQKAYCRAIKRLIVYGEEAGLLHPDQHLITPTWRALFPALDAALIEESTSKRSALRSAFKRLARWATQAGVSPEDIPLQAPDSVPMASFKATFPPDRDGGFYHARLAWGLLLAARPDLKLRPWVGERRTGRSLPQADWPHPIARGLELLFDREGLGAWAPETRRGYAHRLGGYLGALARAGIEPQAILHGVEDGTDAMRLLFQGLPSGWGSRSAIEHAQRLKVDPAFRAELLEALRALEGRFEGRASDANPFVSAAVAAIVEESKLTTARSLLIKAVAINRGLLGLTERHTGWIGKRLGLLEQMMKRKPSAYALKKRAVFRRPGLWKELVGARERLRSHTAQLEAAWKSASGHRAAWLKRRWAVALRDEVLFGLLLCYPLRSRNVLEMKLGEHYFPEHHRLFFPAEQTKNAKEIDYELPDGGSLGDVRDHMARYLAEARPALLAGRASAYVFVPDPRGGTRLREKGLNAILDGISRRFLGDVLPEGVDQLSPHLMRHLSASYHLAIGGNLNLAAQMLNDSPSTITKSYADVLDAKKEATKRFLDGFTA